MQQKFIRYFTTNQKEQDRNLNPEFDQYSNENQVQIYEWINNYTNNIIINKK